MSVPPGRFLKRDSNALQKPIALDDGKYKLPPRGLEGPWEEVSNDKAHAKVMQVLRDLKPSTRDGMECAAGQVAAVDSVHDSMADAMDAHQVVLGHPPALAADAIVPMQGAEESIDVGAESIEPAAGVPFYT